MTSRSAAHAQAEDRLDLSACDEEPIHVPGLIQPHGFLLVLDVDGLTIRQASDNVEHYVNLPVDRLVGHAAEAILGADQVAQVRMMLRDDHLIGASPLKLRMPATPRGRVFDVLMHKVGRALVLEAEPVQEDGDANHQTFGVDVRNAAARLQATQDEETLCQAIAEEFRGITGHDHVMVYRFDSEWHGSVVAESRADGVASSYLGLHFPASDIPRQARRLYVAKRLGYIPDVGYTAVTLSSDERSGGGGPLDMTQCGLRSVSPIHREYLGNMGVGSSITVSLLRDGVLWGLIACHHGQPRLVSPERRLACLFLAQIAESLLKLRAEATEASDRMHTMASQVHLVNLLAQSASLTGLADDPARLLEFVDAQGVAIVRGTECTLLGETPEQEAIPGLVEFIRRSLFEGMYATDSLASGYPPAGKFAAVASGVLAVEVSRERGDYLIWFRPERIRTVNWAGNPDKAFDIDPNTSRLHPRSSFELWKQEVALHSTRWRAQELEAADNLRATLCRVMASEEERAREVRHRTRGMRRSRDTAEAANIAKSEFLANMSHELRTPLTAILGFTDVLADTNDSDITEADRREYVRTIQRNGEHLLAVINDILDLSKIEAGKMSVESIDVQPVGVLLDVESLMRVKARAKDISLSIVLETPIPATIQSDPVRLKQVLLNLVGNAIKFTEEGSLTIRVGFDPTPADGPALRIEIVDTGIGMTTEQLEGLFGGFVQGDASTTRRFGGTGLGLRISRSLAHLLGGEVTAASEAGEGSVFTVHVSTGPVDGVPMVQTLESDRTSGAERDRVPTAHEATALEGRRIFLVEDGLDNQRLFAHHLRRAGAEVVIFNDGTHALRAMTTDGTLEGPLPDDPPCDLVLTDMQMPGMDGYTLARQLRNKGWTRRIIAITAHAMPGDAEKCIEAGCDGYVSKPINGAALVRSCRDAMPAT